MSDLSENTIWIQMLLEKWKETQCYSGSLQWRHMFPSAKLGCFFAVDVARVIQRKHKKHN